MKTFARTSRVWQVLRSFMILTIAIMLLGPRWMRGEPVGRLLTDLEMSSIFGDTPGAGVAIISGKGSRAAQQ
jgi:hypothetical protein